jgi:hypothetical protein
LSPADAFEQDDPDHGDAIREVNSENSLEIITALKESLELQMIRFAIFFGALAINMSAIPALASQCASPSEMAATLTRWAAVRRQFVQATNYETACRVLAASFYESVATRQATAACVHEAGRSPDVGALDSEINAFNDLLSAKCSS